MKCYTIIKKTSYHTKSSFYSLQDIVLCQVPAESYYEPKDNLAEGSNAESQTEAKKFNNVFIG